MTRKQMDETREKLLKMMNGDLLDIYGRISKDWDFPGTKDQREYTAIVRQIILDRMIH